MADEVVTIICIHPKVNYLQPLKVNYLQPLWIPCVLSRLRNMTTLYRKSKNLHIVQDNTQHHVTKWHLPALARWLHHKAHVLQLEKSKIQSSHLRDCILKKHTPALASSSKSAQNIVTYIPNLQIWKNDYISNLGFEDYTTSVIYSSYTTIPDLCRPATSLNACLVIDKLQEAQNPK